MTAEKRKPSHFEQMAEAARERVGINPANTGSLTQAQQLELLAKMHPPKPSNVFGREKPTPKQIADARRKV